MGRIGFTLTPTLSLERRGHFVPVLPLPPRERVGVRSLSFKFLQGKKNVLQNTIQILQDFIVPKAKNMITGLFNGLGAFCIIWIIRMLTAIGFNHKLVRTADKIGDVGADRNLPRKFITRQSAVAQCEPELLFRFGLILTQGAAALVLSSMNHILPYYKYPLTLTLSPHGRGKKHSTSLPLPPRERVGVRVESSRNTITHA